MNVKKEWEEEENKLCTTPKGLFFQPSLLTANKPQEPS